jgi:transcriptional regulator with XRE-family HTH domain
MSESHANRARTLGALLEKARQQAGRSAEECASALGISTDQWTAVERGDYPISLPELETLSLFLDVPMAALWGKEPLVASGTFDYAAYRSLRQVMIGALIRQARLEAKRSPEEAADACGLPADALEAIESGTTAITLLDLERLATFLGVPLSYFEESHHGPLARRAAEHKMLRRFAELAPDARQFVAEPVNQSYLDVAMHLSGLDVYRLRAIAESILEITY